MKTTLLLTRDGERIKVEGPGCPLFVHPRTDPKVAALLDEDWRITGHIDDKDD